MMLKALLIDVRETISKGLVSHDVDVRIGMQQPWNYRPDVIITTRDPQNIKLIRSRYKDKPIIIYSMKYSIEEVRRLFDMGVEDYLQDPTFNQLVHAMEHCLYRQSSGTKCIEEGLASISAFALQARSIPNGGG